MMNNDATIADLLDDGKLNGSIYTNQNLMLGGLMPPMLGLNNVDPNTRLQADMMDGKLDGQIQNPMAMQMLQQEQARKAEQQHQQELEAARQEATREAERKAEAARLAEEKRRREEAERQRLEQERQEKQRQYEQHMHQGKTHLEQNQYDAAIGSFHSAISYKDHDVYARYYCARAYELKGDYLKAIEQYRKLSNDSTQISELPATIATCTQKINQICNEQLMLAHTHFSNQEYASAKAVCDRIIAYVQYSSEQHYKNQITSLLAAIEWQNIRVNINGRFDIIRQKIPQTVDHGPVVQALEELKDTYLRHHVNLSNEENSLYGELIICLQNAQLALEQQRAREKREHERKQNIARQEKIDGLLVNVKRELKIGNLEVAQKIFDQAADTHDDISYPEDVGIKYIAKEVFASSKGQIQDAVIEFLIRKKQVPQLLTNILNKVFENRPDCKKMDQEVENAITTTLRGLIGKAWVKFDRRDNDEIINNIAHIISDDLRTHNCLVRCCYSGDCYLDDLDKVVRSIEQCVADYAPVNPPEIELAIFKPVQAQPVMLYQFNSNNQFTEASIDQYADKKAYPSAPTITTL